MSARTLYAIVPMTFMRKDLTADEKLEILELYLQEVALKIKSGYNKAKGTKTLLVIRLRNIFLIIVSENPITILAKCC